MKRHKAWVLGAALLLAGCQQQQVDIERNVQEQAAPDIQATVLPDEPPRLADELAAKREAGQDRQPAEVKETMAAAQERLADSGIVEKALKVGDTVPEFTLQGTDGTPVSSADLLAKGPVVITFYRGGWCPYCNLTLRSLQRSDSELSSAGATLVAITPETMAKAKATRDEAGLGYLVLSDPELKVAKEFGVAFKLDPELKAVYEGFGIKLPEWNGDDSWSLPLPATYVADGSGKITWAYVDVDYTKRAEPSDIVTAVKAMSNGSDPTADIAPDEVSLDNLNSPLITPPTSSPAGPAEAAPGTKP